ncbi:MAG: 1-phosphofructokinase family hexose kinase [Phycisphaerales bacterium JB039]
MRAIVTLTLNPALDVSLRVDQVAPEQKLRCDAPRRDPGGGGLNVSRAIGELGGASVAVYPAGGHTGAELAERLGAEQLETEAIEIGAATRENITVTEGNGGRQFRFNTPGAPLRAEEAQLCLDAVDRRLGPGDLLVISGSLPPGAGPEIYQRAVEFARARSARTIGDSSGEALRALSDAGCSLLKPNARELGQLIGEQLDGAEAIADAARRLTQSGAAEAIVVSMAQRGAMLITPDLRLQATGPEVAQRSRIGAGDSMVGAMTLALARSADWDETLRRGVAGGAAAVMTPGTSLLRRDDFERIVRQVQTQEFGGHG